MGLWYLQVMGKKKTIRIVELRRRLLAFYDGNRRELPWREETDPYRVWVSEVMLQQTRVETVIPYYEKWVERFPDLLSLAEAEEEEVLRAWQGLGYYSRARRLHRGAQLVRERFGGDLPKDSRSLKQLPGVGEYTAGAVASIAFGEPVPAVDGNVKRVLSRLFDLPDPSPAELGELASALVDPERPGDFNQALMELGATVCIPRKPRCNECPIKSECKALARGTVHTRPVPKVRVPVPEVEIVVAVAMARDVEGRAHFLLRKRPQEGLLGGMWEFPGAKVEDLVAQQGSGGSQRAALVLFSKMGLPGRSGADYSPTLRERGGRTTPDDYSEVTELKGVTHGFTHLRARYRPYLLGPLGVEALALPPPRNAVASPKNTAESDRPLPEVGRWISDGDMSEIPLPVAQQKIWRQARDHLGL